MRNKVTGKKLLTVSAGLFLGVIFLYLSCDKINDFF